jgi:hypothetical protein
VPTPARLRAAPPGAPELTSAGRDGSGAVTLQWRPPAGPAPTGYAVYRVDGPDGDAVPVATLRATADGVQRWTDGTAAPGRHSTYCVTAVDRSANQSGASAPRTVT